MTGSRRNRFGFEPIEDMPTGVAPRRRGGPMAAAVRETAEHAAEEAEARVEARRQNAADAKAWRAAEAEGRVLARVPLDEVATDDLPRDRLDLAGVAEADAMDELKASIRAHGQKEPVELYVHAGALQLKKGWRRFTALGQLYAETGDARFATVLARIDRGVDRAPDRGADRGGDDRLRHYVDMVEENILREDLTFAEMAQLAIEAAHDPAIEGAAPEAMVPRLYGALHKTKRSYIRAFVSLLGLLGEDLRFPKAVARDQGVALARALAEHPERVGPLKRALAVVRDADDQAATIRAAIAGRAAEPAPQPRPRRLTVGGIAVTVRPGEVRLGGAADYTALPEARLAAAVAAFQAALDEP